VQKRLNRSRCRCLGFGLGSAQGSMFLWLAHLANTIEPSMCGGDAACCQITLSTCSIVECGFQEMNHPPTAQQTGSYYIPRYAHALHVRRALKIMFCSSCLCNVCIFSLFSFIVAGISVYVLFVYCIFDVAYSLLQKCEINYRHNRPISPSGSICTQPSIVIFRQLFIADMTA